MTREEATEKAYELWNDLGGHPDCTTAVFVREVVSALLAAVEAERAACEAVVEKARCAVTDRSHTGHDVRSIIAYIGDEIAFRRVREFADAIAARRAER